MYLRYRLQKYWHLLKSLLFGALPASLYYGFPGKKLHIYGITGTDGKTTSSTMLYHVLKTAGYKVALISTVAAFIGDEAIDTGFHTTSPEPWKIHKLLKRCVDEGVEHVVLEVTSHGIFQYRVWGIEFELAGVTNITNEHLDYFLNWDTYARVKAQLLQGATHAFLNKSDRSFSLLLSLLKERKTPWTAYTQEPQKNAVGKAIQQRFDEPYNHWNAALIWAMAQHLGVDEKTFVKAIQTFPGVIGRMEEIPNTLGIQVVVDFAHTPNALEVALKALRPKTKGKLIAVHGCAGLRDRTKRPVMGGISSELADLAIFTAEDPRTEDINVIFRQMKEGVKAPNHRKVVTMADRGKAIAYALKEAKKGDTVGIFGKGHEQSMCFGTTEYPWSDQAEVKKVLKSLS